MKTNTTKWKWVYFISMTISVVVIVFLTYCILDQSITITHMSEGYARTENDIKRLAEIFPKNYNKKDILSLLRKKNPDGLIVEKDCAIQFNGLRFEFDNNGSFRNINTRGEYSPEYKCGNTEQTVAR